MKLKVAIKIGIIFSLCCFTSCKGEVIPKPKGELRLEYTKPEFEMVNTDHFSFEKNKVATFKSKANNSVILEYPPLKGAIFLTYKPIKNNLRNLIVDAQKLSYEYSVKADGIKPSDYLNAENNVYGTYFEVTGNAASQAQFYATDSTSHFLTGSIYFKVKPNFDSIYPSANYLQDDIKTIMETLRWKE